MSFGETTSAINPPVRLEKPPKNGCLHKVDGRVFSDLLQVGRLAANQISADYPHLDEANKLVAAYGEQRG